MKNMMKKGLVLLISLNGMLANAGIQNTPGKCLESDFYSGKLHEVVCFQSADVEPGTCIQEIAPVAKCGCEESNEIACRVNYSLRLADNSVANNQLVAQAGTCPQNNNTAKRAAVVVLTGGIFGGVFAYENHKSNTYQQDEISKKVNELLRVIPRCADFKGSVEATPDRRAD